jgi:hypothetical protein
MLLIVLRSRMAQQPPGTNAAVDPVAAMVADVVYPGLRATAIYCDGPSAAGPVGTIAAACIGTRPASVRWCSPT